MRLRRKITVLYIVVLCYKATPFATYETTSLHTVPSDLVLTSDCLTMSFCRHCEFSDSDVTVVEHHMSRVHTTLVLLPGDIMYHPESNPEPVSVAQNSGQDQSCPTGFSPPEEFQEFDESFTIWEHFEAVDVIACTVSEEYDRLCPDCLREDCPGLCFARETHSCACHVDRCYIHGNNTDFDYDEYDRFCEYCLREECHGACVAEGVFHGA